MWSHQLWSGRRICHLRWPGVQTCYNLPMKASKCYLGVNTSVSRAVHLQQAHIVLMLQPHLLDCCVSHTDT